VAERRPACTGTARVRAGTGPRAATLPVACATLPVACATLPAATSVRRRTARTGCAGSLARPAASERANQTRKADNELPARAEPRA
jgi:hypothetical protein